ncbi:MAG: tetratricopeptide repeat-containing sensor histidine kinase [Cyclobacteriaceae bacterium]|nr:tetratricopeptide repeat-containing sensor histidine kinase [Cyclobacteriaceae bacterium]
MNRKIVVILIVSILVMPVIGWSQLQETKVDIIGDPKPLDSTAYLTDNEIYIDTLVSRMSRLDDDSIRVLYLAELTHLSVYYNVAQSYKYGEKASKIADSLDNDYLRVRALMSRADVFTIQGKYLQSLDFYKRAYEIEFSKSFQENIAIITNNIGDSYMELYDYENAYTYFIKSLKLSQNSGDSLLEAVSMFNIGRVYKVQKNYSKALEYINQSKLLSEKINDIEGLAYSDFELGIISHLQSMPNQAIAYLESSIMISDSMGVKELSAQSLMEIAKIKEENDQLIIAMHYYNRALDINESVSNLIGIAEANLGLGVLHIKLNSLESAEGNLYRGLPISLELKDKELESRFYEALSLFYEIKGDFKESLKYYQLYKTNADSVFNSETAMKVALMETQFESEKKDKEIAQFKESRASDAAELQREKAENTILYGGLMFILIISIVLVVNVKSKKKRNDLLRGQKKEIEIKNRQLDKLNNIKDKFFSIISHDLKSPFQSLSGVLELLSMGALSDKELRELLKELKIKFEGTNSLLENLLSWAKIQMKETSHDPTIIELERAINDELEVIQGHLEKGIEVKNKVESFRKVLVDFNMLRLVIRNLVNNAIKFTNKEGKVEILSEDMGEYVCISIKDDGVGISKENLPKIFSSSTSFTTSGTELEKGTGIGLLLCKEFVEMNGGKIWVESDEGNGSTFKFTLKKAS